VRLAQLSRHAVELVGKRFKLVAGVYLDLLLQIAGPDALSAFLKHRDRTHHAPREGETRDDGGRKPKQDQQSRAQDRGVQRGVDLRYWLLHEHLPSQRIDG